MALFGGRLEASLDRALGFPLERRRFRRKHGYRPSLFRPRTYNEKIIWRKLFDRNPLFPRVSDKWLLRGFATEVLGQRIANRYLIPLYAVSDCPQRLDPAALSQPCVVKPTHSSGRVILLPEGLEQSRDWSLESLRAAAGEWLKEPPYRLRHHEWAYSLLKPRLMVEAFVGDASHPAPDYKFLVFGGRVQLIQVHLGRFAEYQRQEFDRQWRPLHETRELPPADRLAPPGSLDEMCWLAERLARPFDFMRVDTYCVEGRIYLGEMTCYPASGRRRFTKTAYDEALGECWEMPTKRLMGLALLMPRLTRAAAGRVDD